MGSPWRGTGAWAGRGYNQVSRVSTRGFPDTCPGYCLLEDESPVEPWVPPFPAPCLPYPVLPASPLWGSMCPTFPLLAPSGLGHRQHRSLG